MGFSLYWGYGPFYFKCSERRPLGLVVVICMFDYYQKEKISQKNYQKEKKFHSIPLKLGYSGYPKNEGFENFELPEMLLKLTRKMLLIQVSSFVPTPTDKEKQKQIS